MNNYRQTLEAEKEYLLDLIPHARADERVQGVKRVREIITILAEMDEGVNWSQEPGDTRARIVLNEVQRGPKVMRS